MKENNKGGGGSGGRSGGRGGGRGEEEHEKIGEKIHDVIYKRFEKYFGVYCVEMFLRSSGISCVPLTDQSVSITYDEGNHTIFSLL